MHHASLSASSSGCAYVRFLNVQIHKCTHNTIKAWYSSHGGKKLGLSFLTRDSNVSSMHVTNLDYSMNTSSTYLNHPGQIGPKRQPKLLKRNGNTRKEESNSAPRNPNLQNTETKLIKTSKNLLRPRNE